MIKLISTIIFCLIAVASYAAMPVNPSYVASDGSGTSCTIGSPCALSYANSNAAAGDVVYLRAGTYTVTDPAIAPRNSGNAGSVITYSGYQDETVTITGQTGVGGINSAGINLSSKSYIKITKLNFTNMSYGLYIDGGGYNEVSYCTFTFRDPWADGTIFSYDPSAIDIGGNSTHNWIHHCTMHGYGAYDGDGSDGSDYGTLFSVGPTTNATELNSNNTIEYNHIYGGGHHAFAINSGFYNVVRNNYIHNEGWWSGEGYTPNCLAEDNGVCGYRVIYSLGAAASVGRTLYEGNAIAYGGQYGGPHMSSGGSGGNFNLCNSNNIVRYNSMFGAALYGMYFSSSLVEAYGIETAKNNRIYNNTFYKNGYNWSSYGVVNEDDPRAYDIYRTGIYFGGDPGVTGNVIKNNLFNGTWSLTHYRTGLQYYPDIYAYSATNVSNNTITNNYTTATYLNAETPIADTPDPLFVNPDISTPLGTTWTNYTVTKPNLSLSSGSPAINGGTYLTTIHADDTSSGTSLILSDNTYFQAGSSAANLKMGSSLASLSGDWILVGATVATASATQITDIAAYSATKGTVKISPAISRSDGDKVWLYKKSDGTQVLYGSAPDYGAYEYGGFTSISGCTIVGGTVK